MDGVEEAALRQGSVAAPAGQPLIAELLDRLERQAGELATIRVLTEEAESTRVSENERADLLQEQVERLSHRLEELEQQRSERRRWWQRNREGEPSS